MGLQTIEAAFKDGSPVFIVDQDSADMNYCRLGSA
jgi:hypothetical protein